MAGMSQDILWDLTLPPWQGHVGLSFCVLGLSVAVLDHPVERSDAIEIRNRILFNFYTGLPHMVEVSNRPRIAVEL